MTGLLAGAIVITLAALGISMAVALWRLLRGPAAQDRLMALDLMNLYGMMMVLVLGLRHASTVYFEAALLIALFGQLSTMAAAKFLLRGEIIE